MHTTKFSSKEPIEVVVVTFDFYNLLDNNVTETIVTTVWAISVTKGIDPTPNAMLSGTPTTSGSISSSKIIGGISDNTYSISCTATTSSSQVFRLTGSIDVKIQ